MEVADPVKSLIIVLLAALMIAGAVAGYYRNRAAGLEMEKEQAALEAVRAKRAHEEADDKAVKEIIRLKDVAAQYEADARRARASAAAAAKNTETVKKAGDVLRSATTNEPVLAECARQGYLCRMAGAR